MDLSKTCSFLDSTSAAKHSDDWSDRLNHKWSVLLLLVFITALIAKHYVGSPIGCWCPGEFTGNYIDYTRKVCWISNTYYVPMEEEIIDPNGVRENGEIPYYQWTHFILMALILLFKLPNSVWRILNRLSGFDLDSMITSVRSLGEPSKSNQREKQMGYFANKVGYASRMRAQMWLPEEYVRCRYLRNCCHSLAYCLSPNHGTYISVLYIMCKFLYLANSIGQIYLLSYFLGMDFPNYGINFLKMVIAGKEFKADTSFPKITLCDFFVREVGIIHHYTVQCVLQINLFNEKIFLTLWFWLLLVSIMNAVSIISWMLRLFIRPIKISYITSHLTRKVVDYDKEYELLEEFVHVYLNTDGIFLMHLVSRNSNDLILTEVLELLWKKFRKEKSEQRAQFESEICPQPDSDVEICGPLSKLSNRNCGFCCP